MPRLEKLGVNMVHLIELGELAMKHDPDQPDGTGIQALAKRYLRQHLPKDLQSGGGWSHSSITYDQIEYAACDALVSRLLAEVLLTLVSESTPTQRVILPPKESIQVGDEMVLR